MEILSKTEFTFCHFFLEKGGSNFLQAGRIMGIFLNISFFSMSFNLT